jgi:Ubiquitin carboxyl-terminal hydrolase
LLILGLQIVAAFPAVSEFVKRWMLPPLDVDAFIADHPDLTKECVKHLSDFLVGLFVNQTPLSVQMWLAGLDCLAKISPIPDMPGSQEGKVFNFNPDQRHQMPFDASDFVTWFLEALSTASNEPLPDDIYCARVTICSCDHIQSCKSTVPTIYRNPVFMTSAEKQPRCVEILSKGSSTGLTGLCVDNNYRTLLQDEARAAVLGEDYHPWVVQDEYFIGNAGVLIRVNRWKVSARGSSTKVTDAIDIPDVIEQHKSGTTQTFRLAMIVCHMGAGINSGHYVGYRITSSRRVYRINDALIDECTAALQCNELSAGYWIDNSIQTTCVMLLYLPNSDNKRIDPPVASVPISADLADISVQSNCGTRGVLKWLHSQTQQDGSATPYTFVDAYDAAEALCACRTTHCRGTYQRFA